MKMNSVTDVDFYQKKWKRHPVAGVKVDLIVRGNLLYLTAGTGTYGECQGWTSIVGRYLEHPRVFVFGKGEKTKIYIGSADMMTRKYRKES